MPSAHQAENAYRLDAATSEWFRARLLKWYGRSTRDFPWRKTSDPFAVLIAELLLHQTWAGKVAPIYETLIRRYPAPKALMNASIDELRTLIRPLGLLYRARTLIDLSRRLVEDYGGRVPEKMDLLRELPGVGDYTASAVLIAAFEHRAGILDTNILRLINRFFGLGGANMVPSTSLRRIFHLTVEGLFPPRKTRDFLYALLDFGAVVCTFYAPDCSGCPLPAKCVALQRGWDIPTSSTSRARHPRTPDQSDQRR